MILYKITNTINNKIYIGVYSIQKYKKFEDYYGSGILIKKAIKKYGREVFIKEILEDNISTIEDLFKKEIYYIGLYKSTDPKIGYNISKGGDGRFSPHSQSTKNKIAEKTKIRLSIKENHPLYNTHRSKETILKIKEGNLINRENKKIKCFNLFKEDFYRLAKNKVYKKDMISLLYNGEFSKGILISLYREIYEKVNNSKLSSVIKSKEHINKIFKSRKEKDILYPERKLLRKHKSQKGILNPMFGSTFIWINKDNINKRCNLEDFDNMINMGWLKGKIDKIKQLDIEQTNLEDIN